jgi:hypothetical protein
VNSKFIVEFIVVWVCPASGGRTELPTRKSGSGGIQDDAGGQRCAAAIRRTVQRHCNAAGADTCLICLQDGTTEAAAAAAMAALAIRLQSMPENRGALVQLEPLLSYTVMLLVPTRVSLACEQQQ